MFVYKLERSWFKHPFWRSRFLLNDETMLRDIHARIVETLGVYPIGSVVLLRSDRLAMVVAQDVADYTRPRVKPFVTNVTGKFLETDEIALASCYGDDEVVETVEPSDYRIDDFPRIRERLFKKAQSQGN